MAWDLTETADAARRLDGSSTLRAFVMPASIAGAFGFLVIAAWQSFSDSYSGWDSGAMLIVIAFLSLAISPLLNILVDALARQPMPRVSGAIALISGLILHAGLAALIAALVFFGLALGIDKDAREGLAADAAYLVQVPSAGLEGLLGAATYGLFGWLLWRAARVETALASSTPRALLLGDIGGAGIWTRLAYLLGLPSSLWNAGALLTGAFWLFILARALIYFAVGAGVIFVQMMLDPYGQAGAAAWPGGLAAGSLVLGHVLFLTAKRLAARRIWREEGAETAGPILFLRSFQDDQLTFRKSWFDLPGRWLELWSFRRSVDEVLIDEFAWYGPVIALGQPGETRTPFGASRRYVDHDNWKQVVEDAAQRAHVIVVAAGETPGLSWEYELIARRNYFGKTVFLFPPAGRDDPRAGRALGLFNAAFPFAGLAPPEGQALIAASVRDGVVDTVVASRPLAQAYLVALRRFMQAREAAIGRSAGDRPWQGGAWAGALAGIFAGILIGILLGMAMASDF
ncbi:MAG: hypothetical protein Q8L84_15305 [Hyphomonas sp.]|nr:hypothetical protein [Hyphomonas sp.]